MTELERQLKQLEFQFKQPEKDESDGEPESGRVSPQPQQQEKTPENEESIMNLLFGGKRKQQSQEGVTDHLQVPNQNSDYKEALQDSGRSLQNSAARNYLDSTFN